VINGTNTPGKDNPRWPIGNTTETVKVPDADSASAPCSPTVPGTGVSGRLVTAVPDVLRIAAAAGIAWLIGLPRRAGRRLFAMNDAEAGWRGWQVIELTGGLARQYRDSRFDTMRARPNAPDEIPPGGPLRNFEAKPEAWDDHWNGRPLGGEH
jgi:hypothetical protein